MNEFTLDTDIGTDVDDLSALAMILGSPELSLQAVSTVYSDTLLRAQIVRRAHGFAGRERRRSRLERASPLGPSGLVGRP
jgi:purine nucleosidase